MFSSRPQPATDDFLQLAQTPGSDLSPGFQRLRDAIWTSYPPAAAEETTRLLDAISAGTPVGQTSKAFHWVTTAGRVRTVLAINARATTLGITLVADVLVETVQAEAVTVNSVPIALMVGPPLRRFMLDLTPQGVRQLLMAWSPTFQVQSYENLSNQLRTLALRSADISQQPNFMQVRSQV